MNELMNSLGATRKLILERKMSLRRFWDRGFSLWRFKFVLLHRFFHNQESFSRRAKSNKNSILFFLKSFLGYEKIDIRKEILKLVMPNPLPPTKKRPSDVFRSKIYLSRFKICIPTSIRIFTKFFKEKFSLVIPGFDVYSLIPCVSWW